jgi:2-phosphosulfolactate phosphatase
MSLLIKVYTLPKFVDPGELAGGTVVVIDVLRASTTIIYALQAGARAVIPYGEVDEARKMAAWYLPDERILGGERGRVLIDGFDLGNSPEEYTAEAVGGKTVIFTTTNGTRALIHARQAGEILIGAFVNASAVANILQGREVVHLLCAGTEGQASNDDILCAGMLVEILRRPGGGQCELNDQAIAAGDLWLHTFTMDAASGGLSRFSGHRRAAMVGENGNVPFTPEPERLTEVLKESLGGKNLVLLGLQRDILAAARIDRFAIVPRFDPRTSEIHRS